jgi:hypothetical protein
MGRLLEGELEVRRPALRVGVVTMLVEEVPHASALVGVWRLQPSTAAVDALRVVVAQL